jgi:hypothetical protein
MALFRLQAGSNRWLALGDQGFWIGEAAAVACPLNSAWTRTQILLGAVRLVGMTIILLLGMIGPALLRRDSRGGCLYVVRSERLKTIEVVKSGSINS